MAETITHAASVNSKEIKQKGRRRRLYAKLLLMLMGLLMGCLMAEIILRVINYSYPIFYTTDYYRGYAPRPLVEGWFWVENKVYIRINSEGLRDREHQKTKPADTVRIAVLGDSFAEARQVEMDKTFWAVMEQKLQACDAFPGKKVEVINFGIGGYSTAQELLTLRQQVWAYSPDIVVLAVTTYNDIVDNYRPLKRTEEIPYFVYQDGKLTYDASFRDSSTYHWQDSRLNKFGRFLRDSSRLMQLIHHAHFALRTRISTWRAQRAAAAQPQTANTASTQATQTQQPVTAKVLAEEIGFNNMIYRAPVDNDWSEAWRVTEGLVTEMRDEVKQGGAQFLVVAISTDIQVYPNKPVRDALIKRIGVEDLYYPNRRLQALAEREQFAFLDLAEPMQVYADKTGAFLHGFGSDRGNGHWNEAGHQLAGELITNRLCQGGL